MILRNVVAAARGNSQSRTGRRACLLALLPVLLAIAGCGTYGPPARSRIEPAARAPQRGEAAGDLRQELRQIQQTLSRIETNQGSQATELAGSVREVDHLVQKVQKQMYGPSPEQLALERDRLGKQATFGLAGVGVLVGLALFALWAPAVGGTWLAIIAIALIALAVMVPLILILL